MVKNKEKKVKANGRKGEKKDFFFHRGPLKDTDEVKSTNEASNSKGGFKKGLWHVLFQDGITTMQ